MFHQPLGTLSSSQPQPHAHSESKNLKHPFTTTTPSSFQAFLALENRSASINSTISGGPHRATDTQARAIIPENVAHQQPKSSILKQMQLDRLSWTPLGSNITTQIPSKNPHPQAPSQSTNPKTEIKVKQEDQDNVSALPPVHSSSRQRTTCLQDYNLLIAGNTPVNPRPSDQRCLTPQVCNPNRLELYAYIYRLKREDYSFLEKCPELTEDKKDRQFELKVLINVLEDQEEIYTVRREKLNGTDQDSST
ncbi:hypothetical protein M422DRAFT_48906 [Sphaerobolus stellatus SS14]|uniref:Uncharacterized protein n=1 Tax=Sphaerobolus stellatus (strain SS14) TaxID=990650 RepID=A0A0C9V2B1_SPHS4|nr:hypothetical protein M422DRAFT_48906 [Sphaerobolus stellatus SS14]